MTNIEADVIIIHDTEANILAGGIKIGQKAYATDTHKWITRIDDTTYEKIAGELSDGEINSLKIVTLAGSGERPVTVAADGTLQESAGGVVNDYIDLNPSLPSAPTPTEGRLFYNTFDQSIQIFNDNPNYWNIQGSADFIKIVNKTGSLITRGMILDLSGVAVTGSNLALSASHEATACEIANNDEHGWALVVATEDIVVDDAGIACFGGTLLNVDTSMLTVGKPAYLGASGGWTNTRPSGCAKYVLIGTSIVNHASGGVMGIRITDDDYDVEFDGTILERQDYEIVAGTGGDAGKLFCDVWNKSEPTRDLPVPIGGTTYQLNTTTGAGVGGRARIELTQGTTSLAAYNYIYVYASGGEALLGVTSGYPTPPFAPMARVSPWTAARFATDGVFASRRTTSAKVVDNRGIISYMLERLGILPLFVYSGCTPTASIAANVMNLVAAEGIVYQTLRQAMPELEVITDGFYIGNGPGGSGLDNNTKYTDIKLVAGYTSVNEARDTACTGNLVFTLLVNKPTAECKMLCYLPSEIDGTNGAAGLRTYRNDRNTATFSGSPETIYTEFSLCRIPYRLTSGGSTIEFLDPDGSGTTDGQYIINRINHPLGTGGGSGGGGGGLQNLAQVLSEGNDATGLDLVNVGNAEINNDLTVDEGTLHVDSGTGRVAVGHLTPAQPLDVLGGVKCTRVLAESTNTMSYHWGRTTDPVTYFRAARTDNTQVYEQRYDGAGTAEFEVPVGRFFKFIGGILSVSNDIDVAGVYKTSGVSGVSGSFTSDDGKAITVTNGLITAIT